MNNVLISLAGFVIIFLIQLFLRPKKDYGPVYINLEKSTKEDLMYLRFQEKDKVFLPENTIAIQDMSEEDFNKLLELTKKEK